VCGFPPRLEKSLMVSHIRKEGIQNLGPLFRHLGSCLSQKRPDCQLHSQSGSLKFSYHFLAVWVPVQATKGLTINRICKWAFKPLSHFVHVWVPILDLKRGQLEAAFSSDVLSRSSTYTSKQINAASKWGSPWNKRVK